MVGSGLEWDEEKSRSNQEKHGVSFEDACAIFDDCYEEFDREHAYDENRWIAIGPTPVGTVLFVVFTETVQHGIDEEVIRIIGARRASPRENRRYQLYKAMKG